MCAGAIGYGDDLVLSMSRMNKVLAFHPIEGLF